jgi:hypothetical protein
VAWTRKRRAEIDKEDKGLTWEERNRKTTDLLHDDPLWKPSAGLQAAQVFSDRGWFHQKRLFAKAHPDPDFRYRSNSIARSSR